MDNSYRAECIMKCFYPDEYVSGAYDIDYEEWYRRGKRGIIFDIDNTLVPHGAPADERSIALMKRLSDLGYRCLVLSNNKRQRVESFAREAGSGLMYIYKADKPFKKGYLAALEKLGVKTGEALFVGDQIFTDVWGAKRLGIYSILTRPIDPREEIQIVLKRRLEAIVLFFYERQRKKDGSKGKH